MINEKIKEDIIVKILDGDSRFSGEFSYDEMCKAIEEGYELKSKEIYENKLK